MVLRRVFENVIDNAFVTRAGGRIVICATLGES
jgi:hypothetical protein